MAKTRQQKEQDLQAIKDNLQSSQGVVFAADSGLTVAASTDLRNKLRQEKAGWQVVKKTLLKKAVSLERIVSLVGESELSTDDQILFKRARILKNYMTQNFYVTQEQTGKPGVRVRLPETVDDIIKILVGNYDDYPPETFLYLGSLKDLMKR